MTDNVIALPKRTEDMKIWDWLREHADALEREGGHPKDIGVLVVVRYAPDADRYTLSTVRFNATTLESIGALSTATQDIINDRS